MIWINFHVRKGATARERLFVVRVLDCLDSRVLYRHDVLVDSLSCAVSCAKTKVYTKQLEGLIARAHHPRNHDFEAELQTALLEN